MSDMQVRDFFLLRSILNKRNQHVDDGVIVRVVGPVVDVKFDGPVQASIPALTVEDDTPVGHVSTVLELSLAWWCCSYRRYVVNRWCPA